jgi:hypothetical protein
LLAHLRAVPDAVSTVLLIGHNDGIGELARTLVGRGPADALAKLREKYPTGALATLRKADGPWQDLAPGSAELLAFVRANLPAPPLRLPSRRVHRTLRRRQPRTRLPRPIPAQPSRRRQPIRRPGRLVDHTERGRQGTFQSSSTKTVSVRRTAAASIGSAGHVRQARLAASREGGRCRFDAGTAPVAMSTPHRTPVDGDRPITIAFRREMVVGLARWADSCGVTRRWWARTSSTVGGGCRGSQTPRPP